MKRKRVYGNEQMLCGSQSEQTDPDYELHRIQRMRAEYRSLDAEWRGIYLGNLSKHDIEKILAKRFP